MTKPLLQTLVIGLAAALTIALSSCASAALAVTDPRSISTVTSDQYLKRSLQLKYNAQAFESDNIQVETYNHEVLLTGYTIGFINRYHAVKLATAMDGVTTVYDYLQVSRKYVTSATSDTLLTGKVKTALFSTSDVNSNDVKIVSSNGVVYILGIIKKTQLPKILKATRSVEGVKKVVPLLHYKSSATKLNLYSS